MPDAGWDPSVCQKAPSVPWLATPPPLLTVRLERFPATWARTEDAGWETTACLMIQV